MKYAAKAVHIFLVIKEASFADTNRRSHESNFSNNTGALSPRGTLREVSGRIASEGYTYEVALILVAKVSAPKKRTCVSWLRRR